MYCTVFTQFDATLMDTFIRLNPLCLSAATVRSLTSSRLRAKTDLQANSYNHASPCIGISSAMAARTLPQRQNGASEQWKSRLVALCSDNARALMTVQFHVLQNMRAVEGQF